MMPHRSSAQLCLLIMRVCSSSHQSTRGRPVRCGFLLALSLLLVGCMARPGDAPSTTAPTDISPAPPSLLVLHHEDDSDGQLCYEHTRHTLAYAKLPYTSFDLAAGASLPPLSPYRAVVVTTERLGALSIADARRLLQFVEDGGGLAVLFRGWHPMLGPAFGHPAAFDPLFTVLGSTQLQLHGHLMSGADGLTLDSLSLSILDFAATGSSLDSTATVLASAPPSDRPVAWIRRHGKGRALFWNATLLGIKTFRGALLQSIAAVQPFTARPMANAGTMYLDDFPSPGVATKMEPIASELGLSAADFYATRWYPDMRRLADTFGLTYTSTVIFAYNGVVRPPYAFTEWFTGRVATGGQVVYYSPWIAHQDAAHSEMALHGYNHQSLRLDNWPSQQNMTDALDAARARWITEAFAPLPTTYVPPMNQIDSTGMQALLDAFPTLTTVAGLYGGEFDLGQDREFGPDPWNDALYALPRNTSGYIFSDRFRLAMVSLMEVMGVWGHFVHPDEIYPNEDRYDSMHSLGISIPEGGFQWYGEPARDGLYYQFQEWLTFAERQYPWLRYMTAKETQATLRAYDALSWRGDIENRTLQLQTSQTPSFFVVTAPPDTPPPFLRGGDLLQRTETPLLTKFVVRATAHDLTLQFALPAHASAR